MPLSVHLDLTLKLIFWTTFFFNSSLFLVALKETAQGNDSSFFRDIQFGSQVTTSTVFEL